ncbi:MAG: hypothetical protein ABW252_10015 [Polyangiales bacterium]
MRGLHERKLLRRFDYLSSVSGGSYANGYLQAMTAPAARKKMDLAETGDHEAWVHEALADIGVKERLRETGKYLAPGSSKTGLLNMAAILAAYGSALAQHWLWLLSLPVALGSIANLFPDLLALALGLGWTALGGVVCIRFVIFPFVVTGKDRRDESTVLTLETAVLLLFLLLGTVAASAWFANVALSRLSGAFQTLHAYAPQACDFCFKHCESYVRALLGPLPRYSPEARRALVSVGVAGVLTFIQSPNRTSLHRYFSARLTTAFLSRCSPPQGQERWRKILAASSRTLAMVSGTVGMGWFFGTGQVWGALAAALILWLLFALARRLQASPIIHLHDLDGSAPYPLFNACMNLMCRGSTPTCTQTSDYFLFSPRACGAATLGYAETGAGQPYARVELADAVASSAAAISPFQGRHLPSATSVLLWLLNLRTDRWVRSPAVVSQHALARALYDRSFMPFGPLTELRALLGRFSPAPPFVNVSDGGFVDNLAVYELLRRKCRTIVVLDGTLDPLYTFTELRNLILRAREELNVDIRFRARPEAEIRPQASDGVSKTCVLFADVRWQSDGTVGTFVYVKPAITALGSRSPTWTDDEDADAYRVYHPAFPQESTGDQYFDEKQWDAYYVLGQVLAEELAEAWPKVHAP